jgi:hypothetical protein
VSDVFREVDEEVRREQLQKLWERYQNLVIAVVLLVVVGVGGWRLYEWWETRKATEVGTRFENAIVLSESGQHAEAEKAFVSIAADGTSGYRGLARLRAGAELALSDPNAAIATYRQIAEDSSIETALRDLAALRAAALLIDASSYNDARRLLEAQAEPAKIFRHSARELLALIAWQTSDMAALRRWYTMMLTDRDTPPSTRSRVEVLLALSATSESKS